MSRPFYNLIAGESLERLAALSDGIFAVAMTLLVLDIHVPSMEKIHSEQELWWQLSALGPRLLMWVMSFMTLGIFWTGQQTQLNHLEKSDRNFGWIHLAFLIFVTVVPFSTNLLAEFMRYRLALVVYWANIFFLGATLYVSWRYASTAGLVKEESREVSCAIERRILIAQSLYAFGALLCLINTYWSLGFIVLVQLNYAIGPRVKALSKL